LSISFAIPFSSCFRPCCLSLEKKNLASHPEWTLDSGHSRLPSIWMAALHEYLVIDQLRY
jgi:hypothetical protein